MQCLPEHEETWKTIDTKDYITLTSALGSQILLSFKNVNALAKCYLGKCLDKQECLYLE